MGILSLEGVISLKQFWPNGKSDADTTKISVTVIDGCFKFNEKVTRCYEGAYVSNSNNAETIKKYGKKLIKRGNSVTIRLQGIDAPELHYRDYEPKNQRKLKGFNIEYRQHLAETSTVELYSFLKTCEFATDKVKCHVVSEVKNPGDVWDVYGRFVGDIIITNPAKQSINLNHWLLEQGYVFPAIYNSMTTPEVKLILDLARKARKKGLIWKYYSSSIKNFDSDLKFRPKGKPDAKRDKGKLIFPKFYRRQCIHFIHSKAEIETRSLFDYIKSKKDDKFVFTKEFLKLRHKAVKSPLSEAISDNLRFLYKPEDITIVEKTAFKVVNEKGIEITKW